MDQQLAIVKQETAKALVPSDHEMMVYHTMAKQAANSKMYKGIGDESGIVVIMLAARELGIPPMQALNGGLNIISGKVEISARMMTALIRRAGHSLQVKKLDDKECVVIGKRSDNGDTITASYSIEEARQAGLIKSGGGWVKNPKDMLFARAVSRVARQLFSDVIGVGYIEGEIPRGGDVEFIPVVESVSEVEVVEQNVDSVAFFLDKFNDKEERANWLEYIQAVSDHFKWTKEQTVENFVKDFPATEKKFISWLNKKK
jgi:hypothetical protein